MKNWFLGVIHCSIWNYQSFLLNEFNLFHRRDSLHGINAQNDNFSHNSFLEFETLDTFLEKRGKGFIQFGMILILRWIFARYFYQWHPVVLSQQRYTLSHSFVIIDHYNDSVQNSFFFSNGHLHSSVNRPETLTKRSTRLLPRDRSVRSSVLSPIILVKRMTLFKVFYAGACIIGLWIGTEIT